MRDRYEQFNFRCIGASGTVNINGEPRNMKEFRKMSRYIMQQDMIQPMLTIEESMMIAADLKLSRELTRTQKTVAVSVEIGERRREK